MKKARRQGRTGQEGREEHDLLLLNTTIKVSLIVLVALAATAVLRRRSAAVRHFVLAVALACAAATPCVARRRAGVAGGNVRG